MEDKKRKTISKSKCGEYTRGGEGARHISRHNPRSQPRHNVNYTTADPRLTTLPTPPPSTSNLHITITIIHSQSLQKGYSHFPI